MAQAEELVLAVPTARLFARRLFQGLERVSPANGGGGAGAAGDGGGNGQEFLDVIFDPGNSRFIPRAAAEQDPSWKQIIPYVVMHVGDRVFLYRRGKKSTETRLVALHSVGLGGHVNPADESLFSAAGRQAYERALHREIHEEVLVDPAIVRSERIVAVINDDSVEVGRVHFGVVHLWELASPEVASRETKIADPRFVAVDELAAPGGPELETWSRLVIEHWARLRS